MSESPQESQHRQVVIDPNGVETRLNEWDEHPTSTAAQLEHWSSCLGSKLNPKGEILQVAVMVSVVKLGEHVICKPV